MFQIKTDTPSLSLSGIPIKWSTEDVSCLSSATWDRGRDSSMGGEWLRRRCSDTSDIDPQIVCNGVRFKKNDKFIKPYQVVTHSSTRSIR